MLERAQALVDSMAGEFELRAADEASHILALADLVEADETDKRVVEIFRVGHELKGQGGTFGYPLISKIGASLCRYVESVADHHRIDLEIVRAHALALRAVASNRITGDGGPVEKQLLGELDRLLEKKIPA
jgi:chemotaxis protein histidine kinase CheA